MSSKSKSSKPAARKSNKPAAEAQTPATETPAAAAQQRNKNPAYDEVFDQAIHALEAGESLAQWKAGRKVRMMQTIRKLYGDSFEQQGRNVVFTGNVKKIDKAHVLANLGLKTERSIPEAFRAQHA